MTGGGEKIDVSEALIRCCVSHVWCQIKSHKYHRYCAWEHFYREFWEAGSGGTEVEDCEYDALARSLTCYLASWGMYSRSSGLMARYDYRIHKGAIRHLLGIRQSLQECSIGPSDDLVLARDVGITKFNEWTAWGLRAYYCKAGICVSDTLETKIMMGAFGSTIAYDSLVVKAIKEINLGRHQSARLQQGGKKKWRSLHSFYENYSDVFQDLSCEIERDREGSQGFKYPIMRIMDMFFWECGRRLEKG